MSQPVYVRSRSLTYAGILIGFLLLGGGAYWLVDTYLINREVSFQALDAGTRAVRFDKAPDFTLSDLKQNPVSLSDFSDKVVVVNFWASWCAPCVEEFPSLLKFIKAFEKEVVVIAVSHDTNPEDAQKFLDKFGVQPSSNFQVLIDLDRGVGKRYGVGALPESFIFSKNLKFERKIVGFRDWMSSVSVAEIQRLINSPL